MNFDLSRRIDKSNVYSCPTLRLRVWEIALRARIASYL